MAALGHPRLGCSANCNQGLTTSTLQEPHPQAQAPRQGSLGTAEVCACHAVQELQGSEMAFGVWAWVAVQSVKVHAKRQLICS